MHRWYLISLVVLAPLLALFAACGDDDNAASPATTSGGTSATSVSSSGGSVAGAPVEFTFTGLKDAKIRYSVKILTDKKVASVRFNVNQFDSAGKTIGPEGANVWDNTVNKKQQAIESGKTYNAEFDAYPNAVKADAKLLSVEFQDGTSWEAPK